MRPANNLPILLNMLFGAVFLPAGAAETGVKSLVLSPMAKESKICADSICFSFCGDATAGELAAGLSVGSSGAASDAAGAEAGSGFNIIMWLEPEDSLVAFNAALALADDRSEEGRVGKECRSRGA